MMYIKLTVLFHLRSVQSIMVRKISSVRHRRIGKSKKLEQYKNNGYSIDADSVASATKQADDSKRAGLDMLPVEEVDCHINTLTKIELVAFLESDDGNR